MLSTPEFKSFAATVVPFLHVTTRISGHENDDLLQRKGRSGFPTLLLLDANGKTIGEPKARTIAAFAEVVAAARQRAHSKAKRSQATRYLMDRVLGSYADPASDRAAYLKHRAALTAEERQTIEREIVQAEFRAALESVDLSKLQPAELTGPEFQAGLLQLLALRDKLGAWPTGAQGSRALVSLLAWADTRRDPELFARWLQDLRGVRKVSPHHDAKLIAWFDQRLAGLRAATVDDHFVTAFRKARDDSGR